MNKITDPEKWAPIAVFAYNRPDKLASMMESLRRCRGFPHSPVTIFVDGPKTVSDRSLVSAVHNYVQGLCLPNVTWSFRDVNLGLRNSIYSGVSELVAQYGRVIVLEDDLVLSPIALQYFNDALRRYEDERRVWSIVGYAYDAPELRDSTSTLILPFAHPWGWATWAHAWDRFELDNRPTTEDLSSHAFKQAFDMNGLYPFTVQLRNSISGRVNSWFIHWYYTIFEHGGVSVFPPRRVLDNFGFNEGSHGGSLNPYDRLVERPLLLDTLPNLYNSEYVDFWALDALKDCRELRVQRFIARAGSVKRTLRQVTSR